jgi:CO dehydrogenase/acetyl-CoA synthase beta subunit
MGKRTEKWNRVKNKLKAKFEAAGIMRCELCYGTFGLAFAHSKKRRFIQTDEDWEEVALLCQPCHEKIEFSGHDNMYEAIRNIIDNR